MPNKTTEAHIQQAVRRVLGREPDLVLWRNQAGVHREGNRAYRYGLVRGASDLIGIGPGGRFVAIECKCRGTLTREQRMFLELVRARGAFAAVIKEQTIEGAERAALEVLRRLRETGLWSGYDQRRKESK